MTGSPMSAADFERRIDEIIAAHPPRSHAAHRSMALLTNDLLQQLGGGFARGGAKWLAAIEGDHADGNPYPLGGDQSVDAWGPRTARRRGYL